MARPRADQPLIPSVLDRLLDEDPRVTSEPAKPRAQVLRELKQSVRRDLENLLNTRWSATTWPPHLEEIERSLVNYGIPDITGSDLGSAGERESFRQIMERAILYFEPRFQSLTIKIMENAEQLDRTLRFRIEGLLRVEPVPEPVAFDSAFEPATGDVEVKGSSQ
jgi:type VI secretion system protein ImpF